MSKSYRLMEREGTCTFHKIKTGSKWVGRVTQHEDGDWLGVIGKTMSKEKTKVDAFNAVVAKHLGYDDVHALRAHNAKVAVENRIRRDAINAELRQTLGDEFFQLLRRI